MSPALIAEAQSLALLPYRTPEEKVAKARALLALKKRAGHGNWQSLCREGLGLAPRTVQEILEVLKKPQPFTREHGVYLLHAVGSGRFKIGRSGSFQQRLKEIRTCSPFTIEVLAFFRCSRSGSQKLEAALHERFSAQRVHMEWFQLTPQQAQQLQLELNC